MNWIGKGWPENKAVPPQPVVILSRQVEVYSDDSPARGRRLGYCPYCDVRLTRHNKTRDHFRPLSNGGKGGLNIVMSCKTCNNLKGNLTFVSVDEVRAFIQRQPLHRRRQMINQSQSTQPFVDPNREKAKEEVATVTISIGQYQAVSHDNALILLGEKSFEKLKRDPLRNQGPTPKHIYPWNVVDYLVGIGGK